MPVDSTHPRRCSVVMSLYCLKCSSLPSSSWNRKRVHQPLHHTVKRGAHTYVARSHQQNAPVTEHKACTGHGGDGGGTGAARGGANPKVQLLCLLLSCQSWEAQAAGRRRQRQDERHRPWDRNSEADQYATHLTQLAWPVLQNLGFSGAVGLVCAVAFKAIGRIVAVGLGTMFAVIQLLAYRGYVTVEWSRIHEEVLRICDVDKDGRFEATDMRTALASLLAAASQGLPSISGFCLGFGMGLRF